mgnify:CR=1 FL=1
MVLHLFDSFFVARPPSLRVWVEPAKHIGADQSARETSKATFWSHPSTEANGIQPYKVSNISVEGLGLGLSLIRKPETSAH